MSNSPDEVSLSSRKWKTQFIDINSPNTSSHPRELELQHASSPPNPLMDMDTNNPLSHSFPNTVPVELQDFSPIKKVSPEPPLVMDPDIDFPDVAMFPLDIAYNIPDQQLTSSSPSSSYKSAEITKPLSDKEELATNFCSPSSTKSNLSLTRHFPKHPVLTFSAASDEVTIQDDLFSEARTLLPSPDPDPSLELFSNTAPSTKPSKPPRPARPPSLVAEEHPLMPVETNPEEDFMESIMKNIDKKDKKSPRFVNNKSLTPPIKVTEHADPDVDADAGSVSSTDTKTTVSDTDSQKHVSTKRLKYRALKDSLMSKANKAYNRYWYPKTKEEEELIRSEARSRKNSESSGDSFFEINCQDVGSLLEDTDCHPEKPAVTPVQQSDADEISEESDIPPKVEVKVPVIPAKTSMRALVLSSNYQKQLLCSLLVCVLAVVAYVVGYTTNIFLQGLLTGAVIPMSFMALYWIFSSRSNIPVVTAEEKAAVQCDRLRSLGKKTTLKDFFQYTESPNFGELRSKNLPYRYIKLKGSIVEAYELNATRDEVLNPSLLTDVQIKSYGLKPVFKVNIAGWKVTVEAPAGYKVTPNNMWKKKYPIWVRKPSWKALTSDYTTVKDDINSFYLFAYYSRYKEFWFEALRRAAVVDAPVDAMGCQELDYNTECTTDIHNIYTSFMERLFNEIPNADDTPPPPPPPPPSKTTPTAPTEGPTVTPPTSNPPTPTDAPPPPPPPTETEPEDGQSETVKPDEIDGMKDVAWINALFGRFLWNILHDVKWEERIRDRIVRKLSSVQTARISALELVEFNMGSTVPLITKTYLPKIDNQGVWSDMDLKWTGKVSLSLVVKIRPNTPQPEPTKNFEQMTLETGSTGSSPTESGKSNRLSSRLMKMIEKIEIQVSVEVTHVSGRVCVNIPPPPTDCLWYGFKTPPVLELTITPRYKGIALNYRFVTTALEKQLKGLFEETFVLPAMESIVVPGMTRNLRTSQITPGTLDLEELLDVASPTSSSSRS